MLWDGCRGQTLRLIENLFSRCRAVRATLRPTRSFCPAGRLSPWRSGLDSAWTMGKAVELDLSDRFGFAVEGAVLGDGSAFRDRTSAVR